MDMEIIITVLLSSVIVALGLSKVWADTNSRILDAIMIITTLVFLITMPIAFSFSTFGKATKTVIYQDEIEEISVDKNTACITTKDGKTIKDEITGKLNKNSDISIIVTTKTLGCFYHETTEIVAANN